MGKFFDKIHVSPHTYTWDGLYKFFMDISHRQVSLLYLPTPAFKLLAKSIDLIQANPILTTDEVDRLGISDAPTATAMTFKDFGVQPVSIESTVTRFMKLFIPQEFQHLPFEKYLKKYQKHIVE